MQDHYEDFVEDVFEELSKYGEVLELNVCENTAEHLNGNVYVVCPFYSLSLSLSLSLIFALRSEKTRRLSIDATK